MADEGGHSSGGLSVCHFDVKKIFLIIKHIFVLLSPPFPITQNKQLTFFNSSFLSLFFFFTFPSFLAYFYFKVIDPFMISAEKKIIPRSYF